MVRVLVVLVGVLAGGQAVAETKWQLHAASWHPGGGDYNEVNPGFGFVRYSQDAPGWIGLGGAYYDSLRGRTIYGGVGREVYGVRLGFGIVDGYDSVWPSVMAQKNWGALTITAMPGAVGFSLEL